ncbi:hypothetical protein [Amycolatopsis japonica]
MRFFAESGEGRPWLLNRRDLLGSAGLTLGVVGGAMLGRGIASLEQNRLSAMDWYFRLFAGWVPGPVSAPTLFVRPSEPLREQHHEIGWQAQWPLPHRSAGVRANHFTMMSEHAAETAATVAKWIDNLASSEAMPRSQKSSGE